MTERLTLKSIRALFDARGGCQYSGEAVSQLEHALQCAHLAEQAGSGAALITAAFLHDVGHMTSPLEGTPTLRGEDDKHQYHGAVALKGAFPEAVLTPIRLHVEAKRYLCAVDAEYWANLSGDSKRSLVLQGGIHSRDEANEFIGQEHAQDAVNLRRWDDLAKVAGRQTPDLDHFLAIAKKCAI
jgi:phosphonate degradation associated HDIG domain protein